MKTTPPISPPADCRKCVVLVPYAWEDAGVDRPRHATFTLNFGAK